MINLKNKIYLNKGLYDNKDIFECSLESIKSAVNKNLGLYLTVRETKDRVLIIFEDSDLSRLHNLKDKIEDITYDELSYLSFYHIPTLEEVLSLVSGKVDIILNLKIKLKDSNIYSLLDNYKGTFLIIGKANILFNVNKERDNYLLGEIITKQIKSSILNLMVKTDFKSYDVDSYDIFKAKELKLKDDLVFAYLINNQDKYNKYKDIFNYLIVDNYKNLKIDNKFF